MRHAPFAQVGKVLLTLCTEPLRWLRIRFAGGVPGSLVPKRRNQGGSTPQVSLRMVIRGHVSYVQYET